MRKKDMSKPRGGSTRTVTGVGRVEDYTAFQGDGSLDMSYLIGGTFNNGHFVWLFYSVDGSSFARGTVTTNDNLEVNDEPSDTWGAPAFDVGQTVQSYIEVHDATGELLARSDIVTTPFEP